jgi:hypothetical protein
MHRARSNAVPATTLVLCLLLGTSSCRRAVDEPAGADGLHTVEVSASVDTIRIGDRVRVSLTAVHPAGTRVEWPDMDDTEVWTLLDRRTEQHRLDDERMRSALRYTAVPFRLGVHPVAEGTVRFLAEGEDPVEREIPAVPVEVESSIADEDTGVQPVKPLLNWPERWPRWMVVLAGIGLLALLLGWLAGRFLSRSREPERAAPPPPAHETALHALRVLWAKGYHQNGQGEPFFVELSAIVRRYLEDRLGLRALESTTEEFIRAAAGARTLTAEHQTLVGDILVQSDLVKFARARPDASAMQSAFASAERLIRETVPAVPSGGEDAP